MRKLGRRGARSARYSDSGMRRLLFKAPVAAVVVAIAAFVAGINAWLARRGPLPPEFVLLRFDPEPWTGPDVVVWQKMMAWDLSANYAWELLRRDLVARIGTERMADLMPPYAKDGLSI